MTHDALLREILIDLVQSSQRVVRLAAREVDGGSRATWRTLSVLQSHGPLRLGELASLSGVAQPTMTKIVAGLAETDLVKRIADVSDARAWQIAATDKGIRSLEAWRSELADALMPYFEGIPDEDMAVLSRATELLKSRVSLGAGVPEAA